MLDIEDERKLNDYLDRCKLWNLCGVLLVKERNPYRTGNLENLKKAIYYAVEHIEKIRDVLPEFTVHGMQHSCNVLDIMGELLVSMQIITTDEDGKFISVMSSYEVALLILAAFFHDIGMGLLDEDISGEFWYRKYRRRQLYYDDEVLKKIYIRERHHLRVKLFLDDYGSRYSGFCWKEANGNEKYFGELEGICKSHNEGKDVLEQIDKIEKEDGRFCAIILRLADILDLDNTRAPLKEMKSVKFDETEKGIESWYEWKKHRGAGGIRFDSQGGLTLTGETTETIVYQKLDIMVGWIKDELDLCREVLKNTSVPYRDARLPDMVTNRVRAEGFVVGNYKYEIDKNDAIKLFMSENLYMDKMVFVRELLQNAIDASIYYKKIRESNKEMIDSGRDSVSVHVWKDKENNNFFLIKDNGIGMDKEAISNYFLKIGKSFYSSETFLHSGIDFTPISRFGIGFLSAFFATNEIVVVTRHYRQPNIMLQLTINKDTDEYVLRENNINTNRVDFNQSMVDWEGNSVNWLDIFDEEESGTAIYFQIKEESISGNINRFIDAINRYLLFAPVGVACDINGFVVNHENLRDKFMNQISIQLDRDEICTGLHKNVNLFDEGEKVLFESLPLSIEYTDEKGCINGRLQILVVYDTKRKNDTYEFSYELDYDRDSLILKFGRYQRKINSVGLNQGYQMLGLEDKVKIYFNGINHLLMNDTALGAKSSGFLSGYFTLEGKYRPEVDIARSGKGYLDLDTMAHINYLYFEQIQKYVIDDFDKRNAFYSLKHPEILLNIDRPFYLDCEIYDKVIRHFKWSEISIIKTEQGYMSVEEIRGLFNSGDLFEIELFDEVTLNNGQDFKGLLIRYLLKDNFKIVVKIKDNIERIFIRGIIENNENYSLPPLFFIEYENMEILKYGNYPLNKQHWFSEWLIGISEEEEVRENKSYIIQHLQGNLKNNPIRRDELIDDINKIIKKYDDRLLTNRDIITFRSEELDLRDWLVMFGKEEKKTVKSVKRENS